MQSGNATTLADAVDIANQQRSLTSTGGVPTWAILGQQQVEVIHLGQCCSRL